MATKPTRIQSKQVYALINGIPTRRVQSFDWNSNFTIESVFELGNDGIVEDSVNLVETGITWNSNEWGTTYLVYMNIEMFVKGLIPQLPLQLLVMGLKVTG